MSKKEPHKRNADPLLWQEGDDHMASEYADVERVLDRLAEVLPEPPFDVEGTLQKLADVPGISDQVEDLEDLVAYVRACASDEVDEARSAVRGHVEEFADYAEGVIDELIRAYANREAEVPRAYPEIARLAADLVRYLDGDAMAPNTERLRDLLRGLADLKDERGGHVDHTPVGYVAPCPPQKSVPFEWAPGTTPLLVTEGWREGGRR